MNFQRATCNFHSEHRGVFQLWSRINLPPPDNASFSLPRFKRGENVGWHILIAFRTLAASSHTFVEMLGPRKLMALVERLLRNGAFGGGLKIRCNVVFELPSLPVLSGGSGLARIAHGYLCQPRG